MLILFLASIAALLNLGTQLKLASIPPSFQQHLPSVELGLQFLICAAAIFSILESLKKGRQLKEYQQSLQGTSDIVSSLEDELKGHRTSLEKEKESSSKLAESVESLKHELASWEKTHEDQKTELDVLKHKLSEAQSASESSDALSLLAALQSKGRFLDFIDGEISQYSDQQVGAAARLVHQGCSSALEEYLDLSPVHSEQEGSTISIDEDPGQNKYRFIGNLGENNPSQGRLVHKGWQLQKIALPKRNKDQQSMIIYPAEVEI